MASRPALSRLGDPVALELALRDAEGAPWVLRVSPGIEHFIGAYPLLEGFGGDGPLLLFRAAHGHN